MTNWYRTLMDADRNPLHNLPPAQRFQVMVMLSLMWTTVFCAMSGAWLYLGEIVLVHVFLSLGVLITGATFMETRKVESYRDHPKKDGTARYDDVWGA